MRGERAPPLDTGTIATAAAEWQDTPKAVAGQRPKDMPKMGMEVLALSLRRELAK